MFIDVGDHPDSHSLTHSFATRCSSDLGRVPREAMVSTRNRAPWPAASIALRMAAMSFTTLDAVSTCTTSTALILPALSCFSRASSAAGSTARRQSPGSTSTSTPIIFRSEEHTSELQSLMRISYAVFCLKKKKTHQYHLTT